MNTQQKRVKWSRGETADALEERTDTGITNTSAELMENVVCDIYGNVSRRPALKILEMDYWSVPMVELNSPLPYIPFFITENDFVLIAADPNTSGDNVRLSRIKNRKGVSQGKKNVKVSGFYIDKNTSYAQQNNYMIVANYGGIYKLTLELEDSNDYTLTVDKFIYSGGWYAPNGTQDYSVSNAEVSGLLFNEDKKGATNYIAYNPDGSTTVYQMLDTGLTGAQIESFSEQFPVGCIIQMPNLGCSFRLEGISVGPDSGLQLLFPNTVFDGVVNFGDTPPSSGTYAWITNKYGAWMFMDVTLYEDGVSKDTVNYWGRGGAVIVTGNQVYKANDGQWTNNTSSAHLYVYGAFLTPIVDKSLTDSVVNVTTGFVNLTANNMQTPLPHPAVVAFKDQRLWTSAYLYDYKVDTTTGPVYSYDYFTYPGLVVASQIAKYTDFKNDYNYENEAITLDILTKFKEEVIYLVDYNGLKIFTDYAEYDYSGSVVKQSENGVLRGCQPLVFKSLLLYADKTGHQIKALQYELQSNIFASNIINSLAPQDLVGNPVKFAGEEEKEHFVGHFLYVLNSDSNSPRVSVCDFVPDTQNIIWSRFNFGWTGTDFNTDPFPPIIDIIGLKKPIFVVVAGVEMTGGVSIGQNGVFAEWDYNAIMDFQVNLQPTDTVYKIAEFSDSSSPSLKRLVTIPHATVSVYDGDKYMWDDTTDEDGTLSKPLTSLTNPIVGIPIKAKIRSHPIDVGGKTKSIAKRISKSLLSMRDTNAGAITVNKKTGYWNHDNSYVNFYNCTGMKREVKLEIENIHSAKFTIESVLMNIEYGTLVS